MRRAARGAVVSCRVSPGGPQPNESRVSGSWRSFRRGRVMRGAECAAVSVAKLGAEQLRVETEYRTVKRGREAAQLRHDPEYYKATQAAIEA